MLGCIDRSIGSRDSYLKVNRLLNYSNLILLRSLKCNFGEMKSKTINLLFRAVTEEETGFEHLKLNYAPAMFRVIQEVYTPVAPTPRCYINSLNRNVHNLLGGLPWLISCAKVVLRAIISRNWDLSDAMGESTIP